MTQGGESTTGMGGTREKGGETWQGRRGEDSAHRMTRRHAGERRWLGGWRRGEATRCEGRRPNARERVEAENKRGAVKGDLG